jgi:hypothetical protein
MMDLTATDPMRATNADLDRRQRHTTRLLVDVIDATEDATQRYMLRTMLGGAVLWAVLYLLASVLVLAPVHVEHYYANRVVVTEDK